MMGKQSKYTGRVAPDMHRLAPEPQFVPLLGSPDALPADPVPTRSAAILGALRGGQQAERLLCEISYKVANPNGLRDAVLSLVDDPAALEGFCRATQAQLEKVAP